MTGCPCNDATRRGPAILKPAAFAAFALLVASGYAWALSPPTELTPTEPPSTGQPLPPSGSGPRD